MTTGVSTTHKGYGTGDAPSSVPTAVIAMTPSRPAPERRQSENAPRGHAHVPEVKGAEVKSAGAKTIEPVSIVPDSIISSPSQLPGRLMSSRASEYDEPSSSGRPTQKSANGAAPARAHVARFKPGDVLAQRYEVHSVLGEGGMGIVYRCRDHLAERIVAVKQVIIADERTAPDYLSWFSKEARALATLDHPGIVHATDYGQLVGGSPYLVMEFAEGRSLHDLSHVDLSYPFIWSVVDQILDALAHAHARRVIHGDLKPSNILVEDLPDQPPRVHILDFGLAWLKEDPHDERLDGAKAMEFLPHAGAGTPGYMAPEQIQHELHHVCGATDLYALACILHRLLSGRAPFSGEPKELLHKHAYEDAAPLTLAIDAPKGVVGFVGRLLRKRPWERYEFAGEARREWQRLAPERPCSAAAYSVPELEPEPAAHESPTEERPALRFDTASKGPTGLLSIRPPPLVGRQDTRARLLQLAHEVATEQGAPHRLVLLLGPAGVGKSRLAEWLCSAVHEDGRIVPLTARYRRLRSASNGMTGAVTQYFNFERADRVTIEESLLARWGADGKDRELRAWVAGAAEWLRPTPPQTEYRVGPSGVRFTIDSPGVLQQVTRFTLRRIAGGRPLLFFLDDLHNAPGTVIDGLLKIHDTEMDQRILMVATVRTEDVQLGSPIADRLRELRGRLDGEVIQVNPMNRDETCELLRASLPLDDEAVNEAARRSRGFPLFALQQLHAWAHAGEMELSKGSYRVSKEVLDVRPKTTADLWDARLSALTDPEQLAAMAVATLGIDMRVVVIQALLGTLGLPAERSVSALRNSEIILPRGPDRYTWPHALLQEHLLLRLRDQDDADRVFEAAANALEHHPLANTRRVVRQRVINLLNANQSDRAARIFFDFLTLSWNGTLQPRATLDDLDLFEGKLRGLTAAQHDRWRAEVMRHAGNSSEASRYAERARQALERTGDEISLAHCLRLLGQLNTDLGNAKEGLRLVGMAHQAFTRTGNALGMAQCEAAVGEIEYLQGNYERARRAAQSGANHFAAEGRALGLGQCLVLLSWIAHSEGSAKRARRLAFEARDALEGSGYRPGLAETTLLTAHIEHRVSNFYSALNNAQEALSLFEALGMPRGKASSERLLAMVAIDTDDLDNAHIHASRSLRLCQAISDPCGEIQATILLVQVHLARRELTMAKELMPPFKDVTALEPGPKQHFLLTQAWLSLDSGDPAAALRSLKEATSTFGTLSQAGEHSTQLLARLSRFNWPDDEALDLIEEWRRAIDDHERRDQA
jgi:serine/threonine protein kinase/tetratricopeptide (TPR) repeat protein